MTTYASALLPRMPNPICVVALSHIDLFWGRSSFQLLRSVALAIKLISWVIFQIILYLGCTYNIRYYLELKLNYGSACYS